MEAYKTVDLSLSHCDRRQVEMKTKIIDRYSKRLNRAKYSIIRLIEKKTPPVHFELILDIERKDNVIYLGS